MSDPFLLFPGLAAALHCRPTPTPPVPRQGLRRRKIDLLFRFGKDDGVRRDVTTEVGNDPFLKNHSWRDHDSGHDIQGVLFSKGFLLGDGGGEGRIRYCCTFTYVALDSVHGFNGIVRCHRSRRQLGVGLDTLLPVDRAHLFLWYSEIFTSPVARYRGL